MAEGTREPPNGEPPNGENVRGVRAPRSAPIAGMLWMALASALFAVMNLLVRLASARLPWTEVAAARTTVGALVAIAFALGRGSGLTIHDRGLSWTRSIFGTGAMICGFYAMGAPSIALGDVITLGSTSPIFIALLSPWLLRERSGRRVWVATALAFVGVALVAGPSFHLKGPVAAVATLGGFLTALAMIWLRRLGLGGGASGSARESPEAIVAHFSSVAAVTTVALALPTLKRPDLPGAVMLVTIGLLGGLAQLAMTRAYALEQAARLGAVGYLSIVFAHLLGMLVLAERPGVPEVVGALLIIASGAGLGIAAMRDAQRASLASVAPPRR